MKNRQSISSGNNSINLQAGRDVNFFTTNFPTELVDQKIENEVQILRKSRFFKEFDHIRFSVKLGRRLYKGGDLCGATDIIRSRALAWCARLLAYSPEIDKAEEYIKLAKNLGDSFEIDIADAFIVSQKGNKNGAFKILAEIDTPSARAAALVIVAHHHGSESATDWIKNAGIDISSLDADGKCFLLIQQLDLGHWKVAEEILDELRDQDLAETPVLYHMMAITRLLSAVPAELRAIVVKQLPFDAANFPIAEDADAMDLRRKAFQHFTEAALIAQEFNCPVAARIDGDYALWLELRDPQTATQGREKLKEKLHDPKSALRLVPFALQFGIKLDIAAVNQEIDRHIALHGGISQDAAIARFSLAFIQKSQKNVADYLDRHYEDLSRFIDKKSMGFLQIEMLSKAGFPEKANERLESLLFEGLSEEEEHLRRIIAEAEGADAVELRKMQFRQSNSLRDLSALVEELENRENWKELCEFGKILFQKTRSVRDAEQLAMALRNAQRTEDLAVFFKPLADFRSQSRNIQMLYCWALYFEGEILEARTELKKLSDEPDDQNYRSLQVNIGISLGDWHSLSAFIASEYQARDMRNAQDLIFAAELAHYLDTPHSKDLTIAAAAKGDSDARVLAAAYYLATKAGWENDENVGQWLHKAVELSRDDGPIQRLSLKDLANRKPEWDRRESEIWQMLIRGDISMFLAAQGLNNSLIDLMLFPAIANLSEQDTRRRSVIPAYSGKRQSVAIDTAKMIIGIDATALLTLSFLNLLDKVLEAFETVYIPHSTLAWLFSEKQKASFHQPSRIRSAYHLQSLLMTDALEKFVPSTIPDSDLAAQIGDELAILIAEAEKIRDDDNTQHIVICPSPVHQIGSLMGEEADLTEHAAVLSSCLAVISKLRQKSQITADEEKRALAYLQLQEKPWLQQPDISDGAVLYLSDLAISYFIHLGILEKLKTAGFIAIVSQSKISECNALISYEKIADKVQEAIKDIRKALNSRIESGHIKMAKKRPFHGSENQSILEHPTFEAFALAEFCDGILIDDRFVNQHVNIDERGAHALIFSTLDILDALVSSGIISFSDNQKFRTQLRRAGYFFIPVRDDELSQHLIDSVITEAKVIETAELKAIRENILRVRMSNWLQLPKEMYWLNSTLNVFISVLNGQWNSNVNLSSIIAFSDWIVEQIDIRGWAHCFGTDFGENNIKTGWSSQILMLLIPPPDASTEHREAYLKWIEKRFLIPLKEQFSDLYVFIIDWYIKQVKEIIEPILSEQIASNNSYTKSFLVQVALELLVPTIIRKSLMKQQEFLNEYGLKADGILTFGTGISFQRSELFNSIGMFLAGISDITASDVNGFEWILQLPDETGELPTLSISYGENSLILPNDVAVFSPVKSIRLRSLEISASDVNLPADTYDVWRKILSERPLEYEEIEKFHSDFRNTPIHIARSIRADIQKGKSSISDLVPTSRRYFERLIGAYDDSASIREYAIGSAKKFIEDLVVKRPYDGCLDSLLLSSHALLTANISVEKLGSEELVRAFSFLKTHGDRISQLGAVEVGLRVLPERPEIESLLIQIVRQIRDDNVDGSTSGFKLLSALFVLVDGELSMTRILSDVPPFYRRLASLSHAALIHRQIISSGMDEIDSLSEWAYNNRVEQYYFQSLADMHLEPRWNPEFSMASQIKADFFGRIIIAAKNNEKSISGSELYNLILSTEPDSLYSLCEFPRPFLPGPLEGEESVNNVLPDEIAEEIDKQLKAEEVGPSSFIALVNFALIFQIETRQAELAAQALKMVNHRLTNIEDRSQLLTISNGLAKVSAVTRANTLADELRILLRRYRRDKAFAISIEDAIPICLVAAASRSDTNEWKKYIGDWLTELSFEDIQADEGKKFHSYLKCLLHAAPELWVSCGRADAAIRSCL